MYNLNICSTGQLVVIGGVNSLNNGTSLAGMDSVWVYDPSSKGWAERKLSSTSSRFPSPCSDHTAVVSKCTTID